MLNKKRLIRGRLCLANSAVIAISTSSVVVAEEECSVLNKQNQIYWRFYAHNTILNAEGKSAWIKDKKYRDSIITVIGKAIGDCMASENEFKCLVRQSLGDKVLIFEDDKKYKHSDFYTISNWNAVYLYNAVNLAINNERYWNGKDFTLENMMEECYKRIKNYYEKAYHIYTKDDKLDRLEEVRELAKTRKLIIGVLETHNKSASERVKANDKGAEFYEQKVNNIEQLQKALNNFHENRGDMESFFDEAITKLNVASPYLSKDDYRMIKRYLRNRCRIIACQELHKNLNQAKSDMIEYGKALHLDKILDDTYRYYSKNFPGSPLKEMKRPLKCNDAKFGVFSSESLIMNTEVNKKIVHNCSNAVQEIGYIPAFCAQKSRTGYGYIQDAEIYIYYVKKIKWSHNGYFFNEVKGIERYDKNEPYKYADLLDLLQGLVVPLKKKLR